MSEIPKKDREVITLREGSSTAADYYRLPENIACELIQGHIVMQAAPTRRHQEILGNLFFEIKDFIQKNRGDCSIYPAPFAVELDDKNVYEPDISVI